MVQKRRLLTQSMVMFIESNILIRYSTVAIQVYRGDEINSVVWLMNEVDDRIESFDLSWRKYGNCECIDCCQRNFRLRKFLQ